MRKFSQFIKKELSEHYKIISNTANQMKKIYKESFRLSGDRKFKQLGSNYNTIKKEMNHFSKVVRSDLSEYDLLILGNHATIRDACNPAMWTICWAVIEGIELMNCGVEPFAFCFTVGLALSAFIGIYSTLWTLTCGEMFAVLCESPDRASREWYCNYQYACY